MWTRVERLDGVGAGAGFGEMFFCAKFLLSSDEPSCHQAVLLPPSKVIPILVDWTQVASTSYIECCWFLRLTQST